MDNQFKAGDTVKLKSGGPIMTISHYNDTFENYHCQWFDGKKLSHGGFQPDMLVKVEPEQPFIGLNRIGS